MKIIILGAGQVGSTVAQALASEANDITVVDTDAPKLRSLRDHLDIRTVHGCGSHPDVLATAGAEDADLVLAVTNSDEINMVACQVAYTVFRTPTKIARVRSGAYLSHRELFAEAALPVDLLINPEQLVTESIHRLIEIPGALQVLDFAKGRVRLVGVKAYPDGTLVGHALRELPSHIPAVETRVAAIFRRGVDIIPEGDTVIEVDDEVFFVTANEHSRVVMGEWHKLDKPVRRVMLAGGGNIGQRLAMALEPKMSVKLIERSLERAQRLSEILDGRTFVLHGDAVDEDLLHEEGIERMDVFCAVTDDDQINVLSAMLAKRMGARKVMALINRSAYVDLIEGGTIDIAISPQQTTVSALLAYVRRGDIVAVHSLRHGAAEAIEVIAHGDWHTSKVVGRAIGEVNLPAGATVDAVVRGDQVIIPHHDTIIENDDHIVLFLADKKRVTEIEKLFQVGITFL